MLLTLKNQAIPLLSVSSAVISRAGDFTILIVAAQLLKPLDFGAFTVFMVIIGLINAMVSGGGDMWLNRFTIARSSKAGRAPCIWPYYIATSGLLGIAVIALGVIGVLGTRSDILQPGQLENYYFAAGLAIATAVIGGFAESILAVLRSAGRITLFFALRDISRPLLILGALIFLEPSSVDAVIGLTLAVWSLLLLISFSYYFGFNAAHLSAPSFSWRQFRLSRWARLSRHTAFLIAGNLTSRLSAYLDVFVLMEIVGFVAVGEYRAAAHFAVGFMVVQHFVFLGLPWQVRQLKTLEGAQSVQKRQRLLLGLSGIALLSLAVLSEWILLLLGERFVTVAPIFILFLCLRFSEITWGPQHEILISNGLTAQDIKAGLIGTGVWILAFSATYPFVDAIPAAVSAAAVASFAGQLTRRIALSKAGVGPVYGHPLKAWAPFAITMCIAIYAVAAL